MEKKKKLPTASGDGSSADSGKLYEHATYASEKRQQACQKSEQAEMNANMPEQKTRVQER